MRASRAERGARAKKRSATRWACKSRVEREVIKVSRRERDVGVGVSKEEKGDIRAKYETKTARPQRARTR